GDVRSSSPNTAGIQNDAIPSGVDVQVGVALRLDRHPLACFVGVDRAESPIAEDILPQPIPTLEVRQVVDHGKSEPLRTVQSGVRLFCTEVEEVLRTTRRDVAGMKVRSAVIDGMAPGISGLESQTMVESASQFALQAMIA